MKKTYIFIMCSLLSLALHAQDSFGSYLRSIIESQEKGILVTARLVEACGLCDTLDAIRDNVYENKYQRAEISDLQVSYGQSGFGFYGTAYAPQHRYYGYTLFAESDDLWETLIGKAYTDITVDDVKEYLLDNYMASPAGNGDDYQSEDNMLNQFVTYHLLPYRLSPDRLVIHLNELGYDKNKPNKLTIPVTEYYTTMGKRRLLRTYESAESGGVFINRFPILDDGRQGSGHELHCDPDKEGIFIDKDKYISPVINGVVYPIDKVLAYTDIVADQMGSIRLRFDIAGLFPELTNNDIRSKRNSDQRSMYVYLPCGDSKYNYLTGLTVNSSSDVVYLNGWNSNWTELCSDEIRVGGNFDFTLQLPPVPVKGMYEVRLNNLANGNGTTAQAYFGTDRDNLSPVGMPIDYSKRLNELNCGWANDTGDDQMDQMADNELHYNGVMKGARSIGGALNSERANSYSQRRILVRQEMSPDKTYYLRFRNCIDTYNKSFFMDYLEFCPESIYDSHEKPEDIW